MLVYSSRTDRYPQKTFLNQKRVHSSHVILADGSERSDLPAAASDIDPEGHAVQREIRRESEDKRIRAFQNERGKSEGTRRTDRGHAKSITSGGKVCLSEQQPKDDQGLPQERGRVD